MRLQFGQHVLDGAARRLSRAGREVHLEPLAFQLLELLVERRPAAVSKAAIHDRLWASTFVSESSLTTLVAQLRKALGAEAGRIRTVRGFGYAFDGVASELDGGGAAAAHATGGGPVAGTRGPCLIWQDRLIPLQPGENVLGRDPDVQVVVDAPGVSRRHARIVVEAGRATVDDLRSKNGTFVDGRSVEAPTGLADRAALGLGRTVLLYRYRREAASTETEIPF
jgi:DNA-binding winged helix-turn-helix (wHTH) protein